MAMASLNSRRGAAQHHDRHVFTARLLKVFFLLLISTIIIGYSYFLWSTIHSAGKGNSNNNTIRAEAAHNGDNNIRGSAVKTFDRQRIATIGYAITVSGCPSNNEARGDFGAGISDGAAILRHSIHLNSYQNYPTSKSLYDYKMYALVHKDAESCARPALEPLGYEILIRDVPVPLEEIEGKYLRDKVSDNGCCGEKEFVKLYAYTLTQHPVVVHLDLDTLVLKPMDKLYDVMMNGAPTDGSNGGIEVAFDDPLMSSAATTNSSNEKKSIDAFFTRDYNMAHPGMEHVGVQGGFLVLRPSIDAFNEFVSVIRKGDFQEHKGWGGLGFGPFYGSMTFQGIIPYFYDHLHPGTGVELNRCVYNNMADNPRDEPTKNDIVSGRCKDGYNRPDKRDVCDDCRSHQIDYVVTTHFTLCQKPWECLPQNADRIQERLCRKFHHEWYRVREDLETTIWGRELIQLTNTEDIIKARGGAFDIEHFRGYCNGHGKNGYIKIKIPSNID